MFYVDKATNKIILTKGDNAELVVKIYDANDEEREVFADDVIKLTVRKYADCPSAVITKTAIDGKFIFVPEDTTNLPSGRYVYDIQLDTFTNKVYTVIPQSIFVLEEEITRK